MLYSWSALDNLQLYTVKKEVCIAHQIGCAKAVFQITPLQVC